VTDIDLYIGGVTEIPLAGAVIGPTFANIFAKQFDNLKQADRFFYNIAVKSGNKIPQFTAGIYFNFVESVCSLFCYVTVVFF